MGASKIQRTLDPLDRAAANLLRLSERFSSMGLLGVLRERVQSLRRELKAQRRSGKLDKHRLRQKADQLFVATVEYLNELLNSLAHEGRTSS